jgi:hypothetical protein
MRTLIFVILCALTWGGAHVYFFRKAIARSWKRRRQRRIEREQAAEHARQAIEAKTSVWMKEYEARQARAAGKPGA